MGSWAVQLLTILGVAVGATGSFVSTRLLDRSRWQREEKLRWDTRRLECYGEFAIAVKHLITVAQRICAGLGLPSTGQVLDQAEGLPTLASAEEELTLKWEYVMMLGGPEVVAAALEWRRAGWHMEWFARGRIAGSDEYKATEYENTLKDHQKARSDFYTAVRAELSIVSELPSSSEPPPWTKLSSDDHKLWGTFVNLVFAVVLAGARSVGSRRRELDK
jgi:hypothetical protein